MNRRDALKAIAAAPLIGLAAAPEKVAVGTLEYRGIKVAAKIVPSGMVAVTLPASAAVRMKIEAIRVRDARGMVLWHMNSRG